MDTKSYDDGLRAAFEAGIRVGTRYPEPDAIPKGEVDLQYRAFRDDLAGNTWQTPRWELERARLLMEQVDGMPTFGYMVRAEPKCRNGNVLKHHTQPCSPGCEYPPLSLGAQMGHPGGHYG
jgi:hypothetical protein